LDYLDDSVRQPEELERLAGLSTLGTIPRLEAADPAEALVMLRTPRAPAAEAYRQLRTNLMYALVDGRLQSILVTSSGAGEGKTTTAANLALALMQLDKRVILVDSDLRRPMLHTLFGLSNSRGLSTLFVSDDPGRRLLQPVGPGRLRVLTAGPLPPNPAELLGTERMAAIAASLAKGADYVVYDSPPLLAVTDAAVLSRQADATLLVVEAGRTAAPTLQQAAAQLRAVEANLAGAVLNRVGPGRGYYHYYNGYYKRWEEAVAAPDGNGNGVLERLRRRALQERVLPFPSRISLIV
ncbi:MAG: CpsD/CapB family tyrosine-protein kinase, partial [Candidatus Promineifilaceae bacterium]|nr:CpsD/CapB family tyrosine-protein kinase [Candidatus Promineifilaceae bacterium]